MIAGDKMKIIIYIILGLLLVCTSQAGDYDEAYDEGFDTGYGLGFDEGFSEGFDRGFDDGCTFVEEDVYNEGWIDGYERAVYDLTGEYVTVDISLI